jgi:diphthine synthase
MLYLIGLGLHDEGDISLKAIEALKSCSSVFYEDYTSKWHGDLKKLESMIGNNIQLLSREQVESDFLLNQKGNVALLVPGDPLTATTHIELMIEARKRGIEFQVIHSSSIYTAVAESGLMLYKFGRTTTLVSGYEPQSPYDVIRENKKAGLHTLVLLDTEKMTVKDGVKMLLKNGAVLSNEKLVACAELGKSIIQYQSAEKLAGEEFPVPAVIIIPGNLNFKEQEALKLWQ